MITWRRCEWGDIATLEYGKALRNYRSGHGGIRVYGTNGPIGYTDSAPHSRGPGVIVGRKGAYRGIHYASHDFAVIDTAFWLHPSEVIDMRWAYYELLGHDINSMDSGSAIPSTSRDAFYRMPVLVPPVNEQRGIAATLGALDDKIESNRRSVELIEHLLMLEFQNLLRTESVDYRPLSELATITKGVSYKSADLQPSTTSLVTLKSFDRNGGYKADGLKQYVGPYKPQQVIEPGEVVVAQTDLTQGAEVVGRAVRVPADGSAEVLVASLDLVIVRPSDSDKITPEYLLGVLVDESFREHCRSRTSGTTVLHLAGDAIPTYLAPIVSAPAQQSFSALSRPLIARADSLNAETARLALLRDTLLPELLSGRIRVPEAEGAVA